MTAEEITDALSDDIAELVAEAEADLGRDLSPAEKESLADEFLAGLDDGQADAGDGAVAGVLDQVAAEFLLTPAEREALLDD